MSIAGHIQALENTKAAYLALVDTGTRAEVESASRAHKEAQAALASAISGDVKPCPGCQRQPHGMLQQIAVGGAVRHGFGIGCLACKDRYAEGLTLDEARETWGADRYHKL